MFAPLITRHLVSRSVGYAGLEEFVLQRQATDVVFFCTCCFCRACEVVTRKSMWELRFETDFANRSPKHEECLFSAQDFISVHPISASREVTCLR